MPHDKITVLVTEANTKNSIVAQRQLSNQPNIVLIGQGLGSLSIAKSWGYCSIYLNSSLEEVLNSHHVDFIVPVGGKSVRYVSEYFGHKAFVPTCESVIRALNKANYSWLQDLGIRVPKTLKLSELQKVINSQNSAKFVLKSSDEAKQKYEPVYLQSPCNTNYIKGLIETKGGESNVIIQEYVEGEARGFFGICNSGKIVDFYMHKRLREIPYTGGSSTACCSIYDPVLLEIAKPIINELDWTGPIMLEFKYDNSLKEYILIEINPKYWGSLELSEKLGKEWVRDTVNYLIYGEEIQPKNYEENVKVYWPLDGDLVSIIKGKTFIDIFKYFKDDYKMPRENLHSFTFKVIWTFLKLIR